MIRALWPGYQLGRAIGRFVVWLCTPVHDPVAAARVYQLGRPDVPTRTATENPAPPFAVFRFRPGVEVTERELQIIRDQLAKTGQGGVIRAANGCVIEFVPERRMRERWRRAMNDGAPL